jgi:hypothetical protein
MSSAQQPGVFTRRHLMMVMALSLSGFALAVAQPPGAASPQGSSSTASVASLKQDLVIAFRPNPAGGAAGPEGSAGGDNSREWEAYKRRAETLMKRN